MELEARLSEVERELEAAKRRISELEEGAAAAAPTGQKG